MANQTATITQRLFLAVVTPLSVLIQYSYDILSVLILKGEKVGLKAVIKSESKFSRGWQGTENQTATITQRYGRWQAQVPSILDPKPSP